MIVVTSHPQILGFPIISLKYVKLGTSNLVQIDTDEYWYMHDRLR